MVTFIVLGSVLLLLGFPLYGSRRGSSTVVFTGACILAAGVGAALLAPLLSQLMPLGGRPGTRAAMGIWELVVLIPLIVASFPLGAYLQRYLPFTLDPVESFMGFALGAAAGVMTVRLLLLALLLAMEGLPEYVLIDTFYVTRQLVYLDGWNNLVTWVTNLAKV